MEFEWDSGKSEATFLHRGFDFAFAAGVFAGPTVEAIDARRVYGEVRVRAVDETQGVILVVVYTDRGATPADHLRPGRQQKGARAVAKPVRMSLEQIKQAGGGRIDRARLDATTEADIRRQTLEDGEDPDAPLPDYQPVPDVQAIRERLHLSQDTFARTIGVPVATVRNWEQRRTGIAPAARTLLRILEREPEAVMRALAQQG